MYVLSAHYRRIIAYFSSQIDTTAYNVIPNISMTEGNDDEKILKNYEQALKWVEKMNLPGQIFSILTTAWREDCVYLYAYYDEDGEQDVNSFILLPMDPELEVTARCVRRNDDPSTNSSRSPKGVRKITH